MKHKKLTNYLVLFFMLTGVGLMIFGQMEKQELEKITQTESIKQEAKPVCSNTIK